MVFLVECDADRALVRTLTSTSKRNIIHSGGGSNVIINLTKRYENSKGLVDEDPGSSKPRSFQRFRETELFEREALKIMYHNDRNNHLIILKPRLEDWVLGAARESGVDIKRYDLPDDALRLHEMINVHLGRFEELIEDLKQRSRRMAKLREILTSASDDRS